jgi:hypothetical protein
LPIEERDMNDDKITLLQLVDELTDEIRTARGIEAAIHGLRNDPGNNDMNFAVANFLYEHAERLVEIKDKLNALRAEEISEHRREAEQEIAQACRGPLREALTSAGWKAPQ